MLINKKCQKIFRVKWDKVAAFLAFMTLVTFLRIAGIDFINRIDPILIPKLPLELLHAPLLGFALVFWEDCFFALPIYYIMKYWKRKWAKILAIVALSMTFGMSHAYQGYIVVGVTMLYPYFISYKYGVKHGFGTVMVCHILYDFITFYTMYLIPYLLLPIL